MVEDLRFKIYINVNNYFKLLHTLMNKQNMGNAISINTKDQFNLVNNECFKLKDQRSFYFSNFYHKFQVELEMIAHRYSIDFLKVKTYYDDYEVFRQKTGGNKNKIYQNLCVLYVNILKVNYLESE